MRFKPITSVILVQYSTDIELPNKLGADCVASLIVKGINNLMTNASGATGENEYLHPP